MSEDCAQPVRTQREIQPDDDGGVLMADDEVEEQVSNGVMDDLFGDAAAPTAEGEECEVRT